MHHRDQDRQYEHIIAMLAIMTTRLEHLEALIRRDDPKILEALRSKLETSTRALDKAVAKARKATEPPKSQPGD